MAPKKEKKKKDEEEKVEESEYASMDLEMLREVVPMLRQQLEKSMLDRNYVQLERVVTYLSVQYRGKKIIFLHNLCYFYYRMQSSNILI